MLWVGMAAPIDAATLETELDRIVPERLEATGAPGVLVAVVQDGQVVLVRGWGMADLEREIPMDGERTLFRVASISKIFTATAIAQLEDQGRVDLDAPVDDYLGGPTLPATFEEPLTLRHLLSHTGGVLNHNIGRASRSPPTQGFAEFMIETMAPRVQPPGRVVLYSNHGNALAGLVVERVSGEPFEAYLETHVLRPLGMHDSTFAYESEEPARVATGYWIEGGVPRPVEPLYVKTVPASGLETTTAELARFMLLHLSEGGVGEPAVLSRRAIERMRTRPDGIHPALPTFHYGFSHTWVDGHPVRRHGGSVPGFLSRMVLFDEHRVGIFVAHNAFGIGLRDELVTVIAQQVLPPGPEPPTVVAAGDGRPRDAAALVGAYRRASIEDTPGRNRVVTMLSQAPIVVDVDEDGFLTVEGDRFVRTGALAYQRAREGKRPETVVFVRDEDGTVQWVHRGSRSAWRRPWITARGPQLTLLGLSGLVLLFAAVGGPGLRHPEGTWRLTTLAAWLVLLGSITPLLTIAWIDQGQPVLMRPLRFGRPWWFAVARGAVLVGGAMAVISAIRQQRARPQRSVAVRTLGWATVVSIAVLLLVELSWATPAPGLVRP